jgi:hypothetical protein
MNYENQILDALMIVSAWDISDEDLADAVNDQAMLMSGHNYGEYLDTLIDIIN